MAVTSLTLDAPGANATQITLRMIDIRKFDSLGHADHGWLDARHHFSFANYHDPARMGWGRIRVWNDDTDRAPRAASRRTRTATWRS